MSRQDNAFGPDTHHGPEARAHVSVAGLGLWRSGGRTVHHESRTTAQGAGRRFRWLDLVDGGSGGAARRAWLLRLGLGLDLAQSSFSRRACSTF